MTAGLRKYQKGKLLPIVEQFYSLQGEGYNVGKAAYFLRIGGCDVGCSWCDTKFSWNPDLHPAVEIDSILSEIKNCPARTVVITGGEPLMFNLDYLCDELKKDGINTMIETSGAHDFSGTWDWVCLSPKIQMPPKAIYFQKANELKIIVAKEDDIDWAVENAKRVNENCELYLQPEWSVQKEIVPVIVRFILDHPEWKISLQAHKFMKIP